MAVITKELLRQIIKDANIRRKIRLREARKDLMRGETDIHSILYLADTDEGQIMLAGKLLGILNQKE